MTEEGLDLIIDNYISDQLSVFLTDLEMFKMFSLNVCILTCKNTANEETEVKIFIYTKSAKEALADVENFIKEAEFNQARKKISEYKKAGIDLIEWSVLEARMARMEILAEAA